MPKPLAGENVLPPARALHSSSLFSLSGKQCLVTGGGSGIGAMIAAGFVANGASVYIVSRKDCSPFAATLTSKYPGQCTWLGADLSVPAQVNALVATLRARLPGSKLHCLVNNSGTNWAQPIDEYSLRGWDKVYNLNVRSVFHLIQQCLPLLEAAASPEDPGRIINISSIDSITVGALDTFAYSSGKAAVSHMTRVLGGKLAARHVTCNAILPGAFPSRMMRATIESVGEENLSNANPLGRIGCVYDMAGVALMLASRAGAWITGACVTLDGGTVVKPRL
eukprot:g5205.t1